MVDMVEAKRQLILDMHKRLKQHVPDRIRGKLHTGLWGQLHTRLWDRLRNVTVRWMGNTIDS